LYDAGSRWGTFVNEQRVFECDLRPGDKIRVGESILRLKLRPSVDHTTLARPSELIRPVETNSLHGSSRDASVQLVRESTATDDLPDADQSSSPPPVRSPATGARRFAADEFIGSAFHRYKVGRLVAETAGGLVFRAESVNDGSPLALKIFKPSLFTTPTAEQRFTRAVKTMFGQRHPHIVELFNAGCWNGWFFTASEFVEGFSAVDLIRQIGIVGMLPADKVLVIAIDLCQALRFAEEIGIVHRNIRPSNILFHRASGRAMLNDLILARSIEPATEQLTQAGDIVGDVNCMSPEQLGSGFPLDHRSDIYQLGVTLYALLTGRPPSEAGSVAATIMQILTTVPEFVRTRNLAVPAALDSVVMKMLAKNPSNRYQSASDLHIDLEKIVNETEQRRVRSYDADPRATGWGGALDGIL
jgi:serine/threonine protein kinase